MSSLGAFLNRFNPVRYFQDPYEFKFNELPLEIVTDHLSPYLSELDISNMSKTSKENNDFFYNDRVWKILSSRDFGIYLNQSNDSWAENYKNYKKSIKIIHEKIQENHSTEYNEILKDLSEENRKDSSLLTSITTFFIKNDSFSDVVNEDLIKNQSLSCAETITKIKILNRFIEKHPNLSIEICKNLIETQGFICVETILSIYSKKQSNNKELQNGPLMDLYIKIITFYINQTNLDRIERLLNENKNLLQNLEIMNLVFQAFLMQNKLDMFLCLINSCDLLELKTMSLFNLINCCLDATEYFPSIDFFLKITNKLTKIPNSLKLLIYTKQFQENDLINCYGKIILFYINQNNLDRIERLLNENRDLLQNLEILTLVYPAFVQQNELDRILSLINSCNVSEFKIGILFHLIECYRVKEFCQINDFQKIENSIDILDSKTDKESLYFELCEIYLDNSNLNSMELTLKKTTGTSRILDYKELLKAYIKNKNFDAIERVLSENRDLLSKDIEISNLICHACIKADKFDELSRIVTFCNWSKLDLFFSSVVRSIAQKYNFKKSDLDKAEKIVSLFIKNPRDRDLSLRHIFLSCQLMRYNCEKNSKRNLLDRMEKIVDKQSSNGRKNFQYFELVRLFLRIEKWIDWTKNVKKLDLFDLKRAENIITEKLILQDDKVSCNGIDLVKIVRYMNYLDFAQLRKIINIAQCENDYKIITLLFIAEAGLDFNNMEKVKESIAMIIEITRSEYIENWKQNSLEIYFEREFQKTFFEVIKDDKAFEDFSQNNKDSIIDEFKKQYQIYQNKKENI